MKSRLKKTFTGAGLMVLCVVTAAMPAAAARGVRSGLEICTQTIIPSLLPLMFLTQLAIKSGLAQSLSRLLSPLTRVFFGLPGQAGLPLLLGMLGGYPAGAAGARALYEGGGLSREQSAFLSTAAVSAGPAFLLGAVGSGLYSSIATGLLLLLIQLISVLLLGLILRLVRPVSAAAPAPDRIRTDRPDFSAALVCAASDSARMLLSVCVFILLFSALGELLGELGLLDLLSSLLGLLGLSPEVSRALPLTILEVCTGCTSASRAGLPLTAFAVGFGGLSVHFQIFSLSSTLGIRKGEFILARLAQGLICSLLCSLALPLLPERVQSVSLPSPAAAAPDAAGSVCLLVMCLMAVVCLPRGFGRLKP